MTSTLEFGVETCRFSSIKISSHLLSPLFLSPPGQLPPIHRFVTALRLHGQGNGSMKNGCRQLLRAHTSDLCYHPPWLGLSSLLPLPSSFFVPCLRFFCREQKTTFRGFFSKGKTRIPFFGVCCATTNHDENMILIYYKPAKQTIDQGKQQLNINLGGDLLGKYEILGYLSKLGAFQHPLDMFQTGRFKKTWGNWRQPSSLWSLIEIDKFHFRGLKTFAKTQTKLNILHFVDSQKSQCTYDLRSILTMERPPPSLHHQANPKFNITYYI